MPAAVVEQLAAELGEWSFGAGEVVVAEGEKGDKLFVVVEGRAEVSVQGPAGPVPVASLERGEYFGEIALLSEEGVREATVTAQTELRALTLSRRVLARLLDEHPDARQGLRSAADQLLVVKFLKQATPFSSLDATSLASLAARLEHVVLPAGAIVVTQGEPGDDCFLLVHGQVEVLLENDGIEPRRIATLDRGAIFGESALLTVAPRNATVRTLEPCELLRLRRADLMEVLGVERQLQRTLLESVRLRGRPQRVETVLEYERVNASGETITILKDPVRAAYFQLSPDGRFLWERLDGTRTLRDLVVDYWDEYRAIAPNIVAELIERLLGAGFLALPSPSNQLRASEELALKKRAVLYLRRLVEWYLPVKGVDAVIARLYRGGGWVLYTRVAQVIFALVSAAGIGAFVYESTRNPLAGRTPLLVLLLPALYGSVFLHELGHALTTKAYGRDVAAAGLGWYWFGPVAYVDTSDMWLAGRRARMAVDAAGPYANVVIASGVALALLGVGPGVVAATLWELALASYLIAVLNLNPLLELDGYYILMDWLERPNLRAKALGWLGRELVPAVSARNARELRRHWFDFAYGISSIVYVGFLVAAAVSLFRLLVEKKLAHVVPSAVASAGAWVLAALIIVSAAVATIGDLRGRSPTQR